jgi:hypothetical protein
VEGRWNDARKAFRWIAVTAAVLVAGLIQVQGAEVALTWADNSSNESGFRIERATQSGAFSEIATVGANVTSYVDGTVSSGTSYSYRVRAYNSSTTSSFSNTATAAIPAASNTAPTISNVGNQTVAQDTSTGPIAVTVGDAETSAGSLSLTASSSNTSLVANGSIALAGSGANRTVTIIPSSGATGSATITLTVSDGASSASDTFVITVNATTPVDTAPTISNVANQTVAQDTSTGAIAVTVGDAQSSAGSLTLSASSSNTSVVPNGNIALGGSGANRTVTVTPAAGATGSATITLTVSDGSLTSTDTFVVTVNATTPTNTAPTISNVGNQTIAQDTSTGAVAVTVGDAETAAGSLALTASSSNTSVVPNGNIALGGAGANRTVTVTPAAGATGSATITLTVSDGQLSDSDTFTVTVNGTSSGNTAPTINVASSITIAPDGSSGEIPVTIGDAETSADSLTLTRASDNGALAPGSRVVLGGSGANRTLTITPNEGETGTATITLTVSDGALETTSDILLTVTNAAPTNTAPTISNIFSRTITEDASTGDIAFTVGDAESAPASLVATASSSNTALVPNGNIVLGGSGGTRTLAMTPQANQSGSTTITVTVSDGALTATDTFQLTVSAVNDAPTISNLGNQTVAQGTATSALPFTVGDVETAAASLTVSATSSNGTLVPSSGIVFGGSGASRTVTVTPAASQSGNATITVTVSDGSGSASDSFVLTVNAASGNAAPTVTNIDNQTTALGGQVGPIAFSVADSESNASGLTVTATSSNQALVPNANILLTGSGANRSITVLAASGQAGTATITIAVSDGISTTTESFVVSFGVAAAPESHMLNLSSRVMYREGSENLIPGFVLTGTENKQVLLRVVGPTLAQAPYNVSGVLPNPRMTLQRWNGTTFADYAGNDDWNSNPNVSQIRQVSEDVSAFPLVEGGNDAVLLVDLAPGQYTIEIDDVNGASGVVIVEIYDAEPDNTNSSLVNMSNRGYVGTGGEVMITGFVVSAEAPKTLLVRAVGPGLGVAPYNVPNTIADPKMDIYRRNPDGSDTLVLSHDNWSDGPDAAEVAAVAADASAFALPAGSKDAAVVVTLDPGVYTVVVSGVSGATGTALVEVYAVE